MKETYFSEREMGPKPQIKEKISKTAWDGINATIQKRIRDYSFGYSYPDECPDGQGPCGCDYDLFYKALKAENPEIDLYQLSDEVPETMAILDLIEFCFQAVGKPIKGKYHSYYQHYHLDFDPDEGRKSFQKDINRIFRRNSLAYELHPNGDIERIAPEGLREILTTTVFRTGDEELDTLLNVAVEKYLHPDINTRRESLEKLWDAWERLKTIEPGKDKKESATNLINKAASEHKFREKLVMKRLN